MTEKRFEVTNISENGNTGLFWLGNDNLSVYDIVRLLNELDSENQKLLRDCDNLIDDNTELVVELNQDNKKLKEILEENEQLKQKIISLEDAKYSYKQDWKQASADCELYKDEIKFLKDENNGLIKKNEQLKLVVKEVIELLSEEVDLFSDKATEHDINAYIELKELDNKDAYYMATATKKAIKLLKGVVDD